jgi:hypothetical protein
MSAKEERIRRMRLGDLQRHLRSRYGSVLPDDDSGRDDLFQLLLPISLGQGHTRKMKNAIEIWAPWMSAGEALQFIDRVNRTPDYLRKPNARILGEKLGLLNHEREAIGIRTIKPADMTDEQLKEQRKTKERVRKWRERRRDGRKDRGAYLANSRERLQPWKKLKQSRATWYRNRAKLCETDRETSVSAIKLTIGAEQPVSLESVESLKERGLPRKQVSRR